MVNNAKLFELLKAGKNAELYKALEENIREESAKGIGSKKPYTIIKAMLKSVEKSANKALHKAHKYNDIFAFIDGHRILFSSDNFGYEIADEHEQFNVGKMVISNNTSDFIPVTIDLATLEAFCKMHKKDKQPFRIFFNGKFIGVNPFYLKESLQFADNNTLYLSDNFDKNNHYKVPMYFFDNEGNISSILLPVNISGMIKENCDLIIENEEKQEKTIENVIDEVIEATKEKIEEVKEDIYEEAKQENENKIADIRKEFNRVYALCEKELYENKILYSLPQDKRFTYADAWDCFISIHEDINEQGYMNRFKVYDHINYKLRNYGYTYEGLWNDNSNSFEYRQPKIENHLYKRISGYALEALEIFLGKLLELKEKQEHPKEKAIYNGLVFSSSYDPDIYDAEKDNVTFTIIKKNNDMFYVGIVKKVNDEIKVLFKDHNINSWKIAYMLCNTYNLEAIT